ncbi:MAG TPA: SRPBCC family protein [Gemmatimonadales bacterium]|nr:SRPBCC family protein [Gemmatimonadales bacterium]
MSTSKLSPGRASTDQIQKSIILRAPRSRVWRALTDPAQFGEWFGALLSGRFVPGQITRGRITIPKYEHLAFEVIVEQVEPERLFSWRWQPGGDPDVDPAEPMTLVVFELEDVAEGTRLTVTESGFDQIPVARRSKAYRENDAGWTGQLENITRYLARPS